VRSPNIYTSSAIVRA